MSCQYEFLEYIRPQIEKELYEQIGKEKDLLRIHKNLDEIFP